MGVVALTGAEWSRSFAAASTAAMTVYDRVMVPRLFQPWATLLLEAAAPQPGEAVLDVATGPGTVARLVAQRVGPTGRVVGCDLSPAMLALAEGIPDPDGAAPISYLLCPADRLDAPDHSVDLVTCQQGVQFFPDRDAALAEMHRVLRPGGRLALAVWCRIEESPPFAALAAALTEVLSPAGTTYRDGPWGLGDGQLLRRLCQNAGFSSIQITRAELPTVFDGGPAQLFETLAASGVAAQVAALDPDGHQRLLQAVARAAAPILDHGTVRSTTAAHLVLAAA